MSLPASFYLVVGVLVVTNLATLFALLTVIFKAGHFVAKTETRIDANTERILRAQNTADRAHLRIDEVLKLTEAEA